MAHDVKFEIPKRELSRSPIVIWVKKDNKNLGRVEISKGGLSWYRPKGGNPLHDLTWTELLNLLNNR